MMKVLQINGSLYRRGGADVVFINTIRSLRARGHKVSEFAAQDRRNYASDYSGFFPHSPQIRSGTVVDKIRGVGPFLYNVEAARNLSALIDKERPDVAHLHLYYGALSGSILKALSEAKVPTVMSVHDYRLLCPAYMFLDGRNAVCEKCKDQRYMRCTINRCSDGSLVQSLMLSAEAYMRKYVIDPKESLKKFIFVSDFSRQKHIEFDSSYARKAALLHNFLPDSEFSDPAPKGSYFLYYGRLSREKGVLTAIEAARIAQVPLYVVGEGAYRERLEKAAGPSIKFLGHKDGVELRALISEASFVVIPSEWYENNPLVVLESYGLGKPVIGARIGGIPEIVEEGTTGYLFTPGDASELAEMYRSASQMDKADYALMSSAAQNYGRARFSESEHMRRLEEIYTSVV